MFAFFNWINRCIFSIVGSYPNVMQCRQKLLDDSLSGLTNAGLPLVDYSSSGFAVSGFSDDIGIYYWVPQFAHWFHLNVYQAYDALNASLLIVSFFLSLLGFVLLFNQPILRLLGGVTTLFLYGNWLPAIFQNAPLELNYDVNLLSVLSFVPLTLYFTKKTNHYYPFVIFLFCAGIIMGYFHYIRSLSPLSTLIVILVMVSLSPILKKGKKLGLILSLMLGFSLPVQHFHHLLTDSEQFVSDPKNGSNVSSSGHHHPLWHSVYIGLGYYQNPFGVDSYSDAVADSAAKQINPKVEYMSPEYGAILKQLYFKKITEHPFFYVGQMLRKAFKMFSHLPHRLFLLLTILAVFMLRFKGLAHFNQLQLNYQEKKYIINLNIALALALAGSLLPAVLVIPAVQYASDFYPLCFIYYMFGVVLFFRWAYVSGKLPIIGFKPTHRYESEQF